MAEAERREILWQERLRREAQWRVLSGRETDLRSPRMRRLAPLITGGFRLLGLYERGRENTRRPVLREFTAPCQDLPPALDGLRILHLSDLHFMEGDPRHTEAIHALTAGLSADYCCLTGDYRYGHFGPIAHAMAGVRDTLAGIRTRHGVYAVLGNHDTSGMVPALEEMGVAVLVNAGRLDTRAGAPLWFAGVDDPHTYRCDSLPDAMAGAPADAFKILLAHTPELVYAAPGHGVGLYLCGHTHGGQICLPLLGPIKTNSRCARRYCRGRWAREGMQGHTSHGLGATDIPLRYLAVPSAAMITLRRGDALAAQST